MTPQEKMSHATQRLSISQPFFACFLLSSNVVEKSVGTMATDGKNIYWDSKFVDQITMEEAMAVVIHEIFHIILKHHLRMLKREHRKWNIACDYIINPDVRAAGYNLPNLPGLEMHQSDKFKGKAAEWVYDRIPDPPAGGGTTIGEVLPAVNEDGSPMSEAQARAEEMEIDTKVIVAAKQAKGVGKLPAGFEQYIKDMQESQVDYTDVLPRFVGGSQPDDYSFQVMNRPYLMEMGMIERGIINNGVGKLVLAIDTSASMSEKEVSHCLGEVNHILNTFAPEETILIQCDSKVQKVDRFDAGDTIDGGLVIKGRGGTAVQPVFRWVEKNLESCDRLIYLTDLGIFDYGSDPGYPVLWVASTKDTDPPYGEVAYIKAG